MKLAGYYGIFVGLMMAAQWAFFIAAGQVPELQTEPIRIAFHLAAEFITALGLVVSSIWLLRRAAWGRSAYLLFTGMLALAAACVLAVAKPSFRGGVALAGHTER